MIKSIIISGLLIMIVNSCHSPQPITGNPDKLTTSSGTAGSAKMSNELPGKLNDGLKTDTNKINGPIKIDSSNRKKDTLRGN
jgi:hypothetical protein